MMEVVIVDDGNRLTVYELVERVIPCIIAKHYTCLPILRTALGHDRITTTEKYLRLVPEAYMEVTEPFNDRFHTITEVLCNEE